MFAVIKAGGKQYRVAEDQVLKVEGVQGEPGTIVQLGDVIMLGGDTPQLGSPMVAGASVAEPGVSGMNLVDGDRIKTGAGGIALITFLNGSTVTVMPGSEVTVKQTSSERATSGMRLFIHAGRVWARVPHGLPDGLRLFRKLGFSEVAVQEGLLRPSRVVLLDRAL